MPPLPVCNKWSEILTLLKVVKINANSSAESVPSGIFQAFKSLPRRSCFWRGQQTHYGDNIL